MSFMNLEALSNSIDFNVNSIRCRKYVISVDNGDD